MELPSTALPERRDYLFDLIATGFLGGFTALLLLGLVWSSPLVSDLAAPFLLAAVVVVYAGNRRLNANAQHTSTPS
jgi:hypothetical protein